MTKLDKVLSYFLIFLLDNRDLQRTQLSRALVHDCIHGLQKQRVKDLPQQQQQVLGRSWLHCSTLQLKSSSINWPFLKRPNNCSQLTALFMLNSAKMYFNRCTWLLYWLDQVSPSAPAAMGEDIRFANNTKRNFLWRSQTFSKAFENSLFRCVRVRSQRTCSKARYNADERARGPVLWEC